MAKIFQSIITNGISISTYVTCTFFAFLCGVIIASVSSVKSQISKSFFMSLVLLPAIVETVILMVNGNIGTGIAVMGAFSLVRFRSVPGKAKEIVALFTVMTAGLTCAAGFVGIAVLFSVIVSLVTLAITFIPLKSDKVMDLRITVPESLNFCDALDDIFKAHTKSYVLFKTKTVNMGSLYRLEYRVVLKKSSKMKEFIDEIRTRNGNLEVMICTSSEREDEL